MNRQTDLTYGSTPGGYAKVQPADPTSEQTSFPADSPNASFYQEWLPPWDARILRLMGATGFPWRAMILCFGVLIIINACPLNPFRPVLGTDGYAQKLREPFADLALSAGESSHDAKLNYRLTAPLICKPFGLDLIGLRWVGFAMALGTIGLLLGFFERLTEDRVAAFWWTLLFCVLPVSARLIYDDYPFDRFAVFFGVAAVCCTQPLLVWAAVFAASWTDERCMLASCWVAVFHAAMWLRTKQSRLGWCAGVVPLAWPAFFVTRWWVWKSTGITLALAGVNTTRWVSHLGSLPTGAFLALETGCLALLAFLLPMLVRKSHRLFAIILLMGLLCSILACAMVVDFTRSLNHFWIALPAILAVALWRMPQLWSSERLRHMGLVLAATSLLFPSTECYLVSETNPKNGNGGSAVFLYMFKPLPVRLGAWLAGVRQGEHPDSP